MSDISFLSTVRSYFCREGLGWGGVGGGVKTGVKSRVMPDWCAAETITQEIVPSIHRTWVCTGMVQWENNSFLRGGFAGLGWRWESPSRRRFVSLPISPSCLIDTGR